MDETVVRRTISAALTRKCSIEEAIALLLTTCEGNEQVFARVMERFYFDPTIAENQLEGVLDRLEEICSELADTPTDSSDWEKAAFLEFYLSSLAAKIRRRIEVPNWSDKLVSHLIRLLFS
jgi:hypothetical protein